MFARLASLVLRYWVLVLAAWVVLAVGISWVAPKWDDVVKDGDFAYLPARMTSSRADKLISLAFPDEASQQSEVVLVVARPKGKLGREDYRIADRLAEIYKPEQGKPLPVGVVPGKPSPITSVWSYDEEVVGDQLKSPRPRRNDPTGPTGQAVLVVLQFNTEFMALDNIDVVKGIFKQLDDLRHEPDFPEGLELGASGSAAIGADMLSAADESLDNTEITTIVLVLVVLLLVYRAPGLVIVPLLAIAVSYVVSTNLLALLARSSESGFIKQLGWFNFRIFTTTEIFIVVILFGAATDYCLFLIARYREELQAGMAPAEAIREALAKTGHALTASAMTTILGLGAMVFADFGKYRYRGPTIAMALIVALLACLTVAPALLRLGGRFVFWPFGVGKPKGRRDGDAAAAPVRPGLMGRFWETLAGVIVAHPALVMVGCLVVLALPAYAGLSVPITYDLLSEMKGDKGLARFVNEALGRHLLRETQGERDSVQGTRLLEKYFPAGETGPITVVAYNPQRNFDSEESRREIERLTNQLFDFTYTNSEEKETTPVLRVRSLMNPLGERPKRYAARDVARKIALQRHPRTKAAFLASGAGYTDHVTRFDLVCQYDPFSKESVRLLTQIDQQFQTLANDPSSPWHGTEFDFTGTTAGIRDLDAVNTSDTRLIKYLVSIAVLAVLIFLLRRPIISCYLIFTVLLGFFVSLGITKPFFAWLLGDAFHGLDWKLPIFLFVILVAVGEDYNIYLVTRVFEEQRRRALEGLRVALVRTGGIITSCGVIMAGTFASMLTGTLQSMYQLGFSLALGVLLDTFVIRTILVPAFLALWARWFGERGEEGTDSRAEALTA